MHQHKLTGVLWLLFLASSQPGCDLECTSWQCLGLSEDPTTTTAPDKPTGGGGAGGATMTDSGGGATGGGGSGGATTTAAGGEMTGGGGSGGINNGGSATGGGGSGGITGSGGGAGGPVDCLVESIAPATGTAEVSLDSKIHVRWTDTTVPASAVDALVLTSADGEDVPLTVTLDPDGKAVTGIAEGEGLRIWQTYTLQVLPAQSLAGLPCTGATATFSTGGLLVEERPLLAAALTGVTVLDGRLYGVSPEYRGLQQFQLNPLSLTGEILTAASPRSLVPAGQALAFAPATYDGVARFRGSPLSFVDTLDTPGSANDVAPFQSDGASYVALADTTGGLRILSAGDVNGNGPMTDLGLVVPDMVPLTGSIKVVDASPDGGLIAASNGANVFLLSSVTPPIPSSFHLEATLPLTASDLRLDGARLFVAQGAGGLSSYDVSVPDAPVLAGTVCAGNATCEPSRLWSAGGDVFATIGPKTGARFEVDGVAGTLTLASTYVADSPVVGITSDGTRVYLATDEGVAHAQASAVAPNMALVGPSGFGRAAGAAHVGSHVYVASQMLGMLTFDWPVGGPPARVDKDLTPGTLLDHAASAITTYGSQILLSDARGGMSMFGLANPADPQLLWSSSAMDNGGYTLIRDQYAYVCAASAGVQILDLSSPGGPAGPLATLTLDQNQGCWDVAISGNWLYMVGADGSSNPQVALFRVADISNPAAPSWMSGPAIFPELESGSSIAVSNGRIFLTGRKLDPSGTGAYRRHLGEVVAPADGSTPTLSYLSDDIGAQHVTAAGPFLFVACGPHGLRTYRVDAAGPPVLLDVSATKGNASETETDAGGLLLAEDRGGVERFRTGIPSN